jgi:hypothetical protein
MKGRLGSFAIYPIEDIRAKEFKHEYYYVTIEGDVSFDINITFAGTNLDKTETKEGKE